jgi:hypothetical protein
VRDWITRGNNAPRQVLELRMTKQLDMAWIGRYVRRRAGRQLADQSFAAAITLRLFETPRLACGHGPAGALAIGELVVWP